MESDLLFHDLTRKVIGVLFDVKNELGFGYPERIYQEAEARGLEESGYFSCFYALRRFL